MQPGQIVHSRPMSDNGAPGRLRSKAPDTGEVLEARVAQLWFWEGFYSRSGVNLRVTFTPSRFRSPTLTCSRSTSTRSCPRGSTSAR